MKNKKLKIAMVTTGKVAFPMQNHHRRFFAPLKVAIDIAQAFSKKGHEVTLFGPKGSSSSVFKTITAPIAPIYQDESLLSMEGIDEPNLAARDREKLLFSLEQHFFSWVLQQCQKESFDILHAHAPNEMMPLVFHHQPSIPVIYTVHDAVFPWRSMVFKTLLTDYQHLVSISVFQQKVSKDLRWVANVHNGINISDYPFYNKGGEQMLFLGRLIPRKGVAQAVQVALTTKNQLLITGSGDEGEYWQEFIAPHLGKGLVRHLAFSSYQEAHRHYGASKVILCPIRWEEPFGLVMTESMACGTPVVAFARGSVPEVIKDGVTGFIVNSSEKDKRGDWIIKKTGIEGMVEAVNKIYNMPEAEYLQMRKNCRKHVEENFTMEKMVDGYEKVYYKILAQHEKKHQ